MLKKLILITLILLPLSLSANESLNDLEENKNSENGYSFDVFLTVSQDIFDAIDDSSGNLDTLGSFSGDLNASFAISLNAPYHFFRHSNAGYYFNYNFNRFDLNEQDTSINSSSLDQDNLGTSVEGYNLYANASVFYNFGKKIILSKKDKSTKVGVGLGLGYLKADGNIILTELPNNPKQDINISGFGPVISFFIDHRRGPWIFRTEASATEVNDSEVDFSYSDISLQIGYTVNF